MYLQSKTDPEMRLDVEYLLNVSRKNWVEVIKNLRAFSSCISQKIYGLGLKDAKEAVEACFVEYSQSQTGFNNQKLLALFQGYAVNFEELEAQENEIPPDLRPQHQELLRIITQAYKNMDAFNFPEIENLLQSIQKNNGLQAIMKC